jgi:hypothetical protein
VYRRPPAGGTLRARKHAIIGPTDPIRPDRSDDTMTEPPEPREPAGHIPLTRAQIDAGERIAGPHDPGPEEQYAGEPVKDPWEEVPDGELDLGSVPGQSAN